MPLVPQGLDESIWCVGRGSMEKKALSGLQRMCKAYGRMKCGDTMMVWDYANDVAVSEKELEFGGERWAESEKAKWKFFKTSN